MLPVGQTGGFGVILVSFVALPCVLYSSNALSHSFPAGLEYLWIDLHSTKQYCRYYSFFDVLSNYDEHFTPAHRVNFANPMPLFFSGYVRFYLFNAVRGSKRCRELFFSRGLGSFSHINVDTHVWLLDIQSSL